VKAWVRVFGALAVLAVAGLATLMGYASELALHPEWYEHRTPEQGLRTMSRGGRALARNPTIDFDLPYREVEFAARDGSTLRGWYVPSVPQARAGVVAVHGAGSDRREFLRHVPFLHEAGYPVLLFDCREHGVSDGDERGISFGVREHEDVSSAVAFAKDHLDLSRVAALGTSQGGAAVILAGARDPRIDAVIAENPFTRVYDLIRDHPATPPETPDALLRLLVTTLEWRIGSLATLAPIDAVARIAPRPLLLMHGTADRAIPVGHSRALFEQAGEPRAIWIVAGGGHAQLFDHDPTGFENRVLAFLTRWIGAPGS
jgi:fermentation-respiration switch protein FrsA (DUF1100 family)